MKADLDTLRGFFRMAPFMVELGIEPTAATEGRVSTSMPLRAVHLQHTGLAHAGVCASLADHTMGAAAQTMAAEGQWVLTAEFKTSQLRPARGERLVCHAQVIKPGRRVMFTEAEVWTETGAQRTLVAKASATMAVTTADD